MNQMNHMYRMLLAAVALAFSSVTASADTITVCASGCDYTSINAAIGAASDGDVIQLAAETYFEGEEIDTLGKAVTLRGVLDKAGEPVSVLDGAGKHRVVTCQSGETSATVFENLVIQNGYSSAFGGGMFNQNFSSPTLTNCVFTGNSAYSGGGMLNIFGSPTLTNCTFTSNSAEYSGGGMFNIECTSFLTHCTFRGNLAGNLGGGMANDFSSPTLTSCTFTSNSAVGGAGGMYNSDSSNPTLIDCTLCDNDAEQVDGPFTNLGGNCLAYSCDDCDLPSDPCPTDLDGNGVTDGGDLGVFFIYWGDCPVEDCPADFNEDNVVDGIDLGILFSAWGPCQ